MQEDGIQIAGDVLIERLKLVSSNNIITDLTEFFIEINLYEDIFSNVLKGNIVISDSRNLIEKLPIIGEEYLFLKFKTPSFDSYIEKTFRVYRISDRTIIKDTSTQNYILHFASIELFYDILLPLYLPFKGSINDIVGEIFENFITTNRNFEISQTEDNIKELESVTPLVLLNEVQNSVKFISPGWTPFKCINWLASKSIPKNEVAKNYLFFESNKSFYFGSVEYILKDAYENKNIIGTYTPTISNIRNGNLAPDLNREFFIARDLVMTDLVDRVKNYTSGYLSNRLLEVDVYNKKYRSIDYDYVNEYKNQYHTSGLGEDAIPSFVEESLRNPVCDISYYPKNEKLFDNFENNVNERMYEIHGNRKSSLLELSNLRLNMTIHGRTDVEVGRLLYMNYPSLEAISNKNENHLDKHYSGYYMITAINHKINKFNNHSMTVECIKDSLNLKRDV